MPVVNDGSRTSEPGQPAQNSVVEDAVQAVLTETTDAPDDIYTSYVMDVGDSFSGNLETIDDVDWVYFEVLGHGNYSFTLSGASSDSGTLFDPFLRIYRYGGLGEIALDNDGGSGTDSALNNIYLSMGTYIIEAGSNLGLYSGSYQITVEVGSLAVLGTLDELAEYMTDGFWQDTSRSQRSFDTSTSNQIPVYIDNLTAEGQQLALWAFEAWETVADLEFIVQTSYIGARIDIMFHDTSSGAFANSMTEGNTIIGSLVNVSPVWLDTHGTSLDSYSFATYMHEIGRALGLGNLGNYYDDENSVYGANTTFTNDSWQTSVMSPFNQTENTTTNASYAAIVSTMMADIVAIQNLYGAPGSNSATAGNTIYGANSALGTYMDQLFDLIAAGTTSSVYGGDPITFTIYDQGGTDTVDLSFSTTHDRVSLLGESFSNIGGLIGNVGIARGTVIENLLAGSGNDTLTGNSVGNQISGNGGNDVISGGNGNDTLSGGLGSDWIFGGFDDDSINGGDGLNHLFGGTGQDTLIGGNQADRLIGEAGHDVLSGGNGNDTLNGNQNADRLYGGFDDDLLYGGDGTDRLFGGTGQDTLYGGSQGDILYGEWGHDVLSGEAGNDTLYGNQNADRLYGGLGNDLLDGGDGLDRLFGGLGNDTLNGGAQNDRLVGEWGNDRLVGGSGNDTLFGDQNQDRLEGGSGNDSLDGGVGFDTLLGGFGNDTLNGGAHADLLAGGDGSDIFVFTDGTGADRVTDFDAFDNAERLDLSGLSAITSFADLTSNHLTQSGANAFINAGSAGTITLLNVQLSDLDASDFIF
ncbi:hypothetical protein EBB79_13025 [Parasedimentitalea marina]|uniref:Peptidase M10 serralysin C-terminal domain-containing protein n=1 Tax=Parasedimentitalea marina TaxID=2483033 RepID=A0A3T0N3Y7_9RHOB|nr:M10 family metallopeptidase C-terminal domain-containing protein [Parasedimentitalea marina]AZV78704.1 hypothetical protein EBB79_13025 [Parasedimentitalea marina]